MFRHIIPANRIDQRESFINELFTAFENVQVLPKPFTFLEAVNTEGARVFLGKGSISTIVDDFLVTSCV